MNKRLHHFLFRGSTIRFVIYWIYLSQIGSVSISSENFSIPRPYKSVFDTPLDFSGNRNRWQIPKDLKEIAIGFFAPDQPSDSVGYSLWRGAELAIEQANAQGGYQNLSFRLIPRWSVNPWGAGSKEMIRLAYEDRVWAVMGSIDGEATHVAEQIATKCFIPLISPIASDPTLTYIRIPWMFRLAPSDRVQAEFLVEAAVESRKCRRLGLITALKHDARIFAHEFSNALERQKSVLLFHLEIPTNLEDFTDIAQSVSRFAPDGIGICLPKKLFTPLVKSLKAKAISCPLFIPWIPELDSMNRLDTYPGEMISLNPFSRDENRPAYHDFTQLYQQKFREAPESCAALAYDAANMIVAAIRKAGFNRAGVRDALAGMNHYEGVGGTILWDNGGGNTSQPIVVSWKFNR